MKLKKIDIKTFKKKIYKYYKQIFPSIERKSFRNLKKNYKLNRCQFIEIYNDKNLVGFMVVNTVDEIPFIQLDYFAIFPEYQNKGYGSEAIKILKDLYNEYIGLFGEIEAVNNDYTTNENDNKIRRKKFYERLGFIFLEYEFDLFGVIYTPCVFYFKEKKLEEEKIIKDMLKTYNTLMGEKRFKKNCSYKSKTT